MKMVGEFNVQSLFLLIFVFVLFVIYRVVFRDRIFFEKFLHSTDLKENTARKIADKYAEKFRTSSLFKATLKVLNLEETEITHIESIGDNFETFSELSEAIKQAGLESSNIIIGIDFTASNEWQGRTSFDHKSLHSISKSRRNPYQQVITTLSSTLEPFDDDKLIPAFGFGDSMSKDNSVFAFKNNGSLCQGFLDVLECYEKIVRNIELSGPTSFVPIIEKAIEITKESNNCYHILLIIADGQVEEDEDEKTQEVIIKASYYPISIVVVGVGDGPWDNMQIYDEKLPSRLFDNFQFVDYHECLSKSHKGSELMFALHALMEIPDQYKKIKQLGLLNSGNNISRTTQLDNDLDNVLDGSYNSNRKDKQDENLYKRNISTFFLGRNSHS